ncbi:hypothetical protein PCASD_02383 [Puccinia coronata f. sp. avenae]|uniref:Uncharacterized protein n=1 Tax=Puccinia coronata f. sp. avenae TaxID=200324 RepID=A0A2N5VB01_9BASI|nr:hypothetical protein PCASD_02383 [Puccinia coronata f. sp. avenae]
MPGLDTVSTTLGEQLFIEERPFCCRGRMFWKAYEAYEYAYEQCIAEQRQAGRAINEPETVKVAMYDAFCARCSQRKTMRDAIRGDKHFIARGRHQKPDLLSLPRTPARDGLIENWNQYAQCVAWTCYDILRHFPNDTLRTDEQ